jgi:hypothetical protein
MVDKLEERKNAGSPNTTPPRPPERTQVVVWLEKNRAQEFADAFYKQGYYDLADLDAAAIEKCVPEDKSGVRSRLKRELEKRNQQYIPEIPPLPPGETFDLSAPSFTTKGNIAFQIPGALSVPDDGKTVIAPGSLTPEQWMVIARNACMLFGRVMDGDEPAFAERPVLVWKVPESNDFFRSEHLSGEVKSELTYTERSSSYVTQGFTKVTASASFPFCSGSAAHERSEKYASRSQSKQTYMIGLWHFPRAEVNLETCTAVSPHFVDEVTQALKLKEKNGEQCAVALAKVFARYGHVVGWKLDVGGRLFFVHHRTETATATEAELHQTTRAAVGIKTAWGSGSASGATGSATKTSSEALNIAETSTFTALGGDATLASNPGAWAGTVKDPNLWAVIGMNEVKTTIDLLPEDLRRQVQEVWRQYGRVGLLHGRKFLLRPAATPGAIAHAGPIPGLPAEVICLRCVDEIAFWVQAVSYLPWMFTSLQEDIYWIKPKEGAYLAYDRVEPEYGLSVTPPQDENGVALGTRREEELPWLWRVYPAEQSQIKESERCPGAYCIQPRAGLDGMSHMYLVFTTPDGVSAMRCEHLDLNVPANGLAAQWYLDPVED